MSARRASARQPLQRWAAPVGSALALQFTAAPDPFQLSRPGQNGSRNRSGRLTASHACDQWSRSAPAGEQLGAP
ncbi:hypothetical protein NDU88_000235 [Pleurodeles waltl]|uniref:Uncharacterized protein n=1 Tax=Pleurodeles waltl TaxID=8319 RepID=A0AAV7VWY2_PLEWA|nr:hypothetical protein NDU88_000234 [Pleurodeles waltl]KAJ1204797.1 hypothetical protein NDU88_000235 [Pleurodeles waltl]